MLHQKHRNSLLEAAGLRTLDGLTKLAGEHAQNFRQLIGSGGRAMVPKFKVRIGTACTGSGADLASMLAMKKALAAADIEFEFEYVFNCEKAGTKRNWILALHDTL